MNKNDVDDNHGYDDYSFFMRAAPASVYLFLLLVRQYFCIIHLHGAKQNE